MQSTKEQVLAYLLNHAGTFVTGQALADQLNLSRESIWKAIQALRQAGFQIQGQAAKGYCYQGTAQLAAQVIEHACRQFKGAITVLTTTPSTQDEAKNYLSRHTLTTPQVWLAEEQTAGYGRRGRAFYSPAQRGLYFSLACRLPQPLLHPGLLTTGIAEAVRTVLQQFYPQAALSLKWVNDVYCNGKKAVGILTEAMMDLETQTAQTVVIGCGMNLTGDAFPADLTAKAGALGPGEKVDRNQLAAALLDAIIQRVGDYQTGAFLPAYRQHSLVLGKEVELRGHHETITGPAVAIDAHGALVVATPTGPRTVVSGEVVKVNVHPNN